MSSLSHIITSPPRNLPLIVGASLVIFTLAKLTFTSLSSPPKKKIIPSPLTTLLPKLTKEEQDEMPYPPDVLPGARDVTSPYGTTRVYEWGPPTGKKILLIPGLSTPCPSLSNLAQHFVLKGCRVLLYDIWGRGYSDAVADLPYDSRLYITQILIAVGSSKGAGSWMEEGFVVIGYSFGGGVAADFAVAFEGVVRDLVLLAPSGLVRREGLGWMTVMNSGLIPDRMLEWVVRKQLVGEERQREKKLKGEKVFTKVDENRDLLFDDIICFHRQSKVFGGIERGVTVGDMIKWQLDHHEGFIRALVSSLRFGSISGQDETWRKLGERQRNGRRKALVIVASRDEDVRPEELKDDVWALVGQEGVELRVVDGGHGFAIGKAEEVARIVSDFWGLDG